MGEKEIQGPRKKEKGKTSPTKFETKKLSKNLWEKFKWGDKKKADFRRKRGKKKNLLPRGRRPERRGF